jgi:hypothetical protein
MSKEEKCSEEPLHCYYYDCNNYIGKPNCYYQEKHLCFDCFEELLDPTQVNCNILSKMLYSILSTPVDSVILNDQASATINRLKILTSDALPMHIRLLYRKNR